MKTTIACATGAVCALAWLGLNLHSGVFAQGTFPDPNANCPRAECGQVSPLIPMQSAEAVHMGLVWKKDSPNPKILFHARFPEYTPNDMADPALIDRAKLAARYRLGAKGRSGERAVRIRDESLSVSVHANSSSSSA